MRRFAVCLALLSWMSLTEWKILERLQYDQPAEVEFVLGSMKGVLDGTPVFKNWQQRFVGPLLLSALSTHTSDPLTALKLFSRLMLLAANLLLFALVRRGGASSSESLLVTVGFGFLRLLLAFRLEYPWDAIDVLLFLTFGYWAAEDKRLIPLAPLLLIGLFNRETVLYLPLWYLLSPVDLGESAPRRQRQLALTFVTTAALGGLIALVRSHFYRGQVLQPGRTIEAVTPIIDNQVHLMHNLRALFIDNWAAGHAHITVGVLTATALLAWSVRTATTRRAACWSLCVIATIVFFGYTNETRLYLPLLAFWSSYAGRALLGRQPLPRQMAIHRRQP